jgi:hypothetical protein
MIRAEWCHALGDWSSALHWVKGGECNALDMV